jgi:hypothetical protein
MVAYLLEKQAVPLDELLTAPPPREEVENRLAALLEW